MTESLLEGIRKREKFVAVTVWIKKHAGYDSVPLSDLAEICGFSPSDLGNTITKLVNRGILVRVADPENARRRPVSLTPEAYTELQHVLLEDLKLLEVGNDS